MFRVPFPHSMALLLFLLLLMAPHPTVEAFVLIPRSETATSSTHLYFFGGLGDAFKNDDKLGKPKDAGLSNGPNYNEAGVTVNGKPVPGAVVGQKLTVVASRVRVKIPVDCQNGDCGTCRVKLNGRIVKGMFSFVCAGVNT
jgi:hypothetical protein